ncbi:MAG: HAMP domain-containing protein [Melioribacteraceae bacterium]|nr:HAMP domain-containing protein [Melioribacteraceae bacterium]
MLLKKKLGAKIVFFFSTFVLVTILVLILFIYFEGKSYLRKNAFERIDYYSGIINKKNESELYNYENEILGLYNLVNQDSENYSKIISDFLLAYPAHYSKIGFCEAKSDSVIIFSKQRAFNGEIFNEKNVEPKEKYLSAFCDNKNPNQKKIRMQIDTTGREINYAAFSKDTEIGLLGIINTSDYLGKILAQIPELELDELLFVNWNGVILNATDKSLINKDISNKEEFKSAKKLEQYSEVLPGNKVLKWWYLSSIKVFIKVSIDFNGSMLKLDSFAINTLIYTFLIYSIFVLVILYLTNQFIGNLKKVTKVAGYVSQGDFSQKIDLKRHDELGLLINTFNDMVFNLDQSYNQLSDVNSELQKKITDLLKAQSALSEAQRLALIGETVAKVTHELQNKIGGIHIWIQNMESLEDLNDTSKLYLMEMKLAVNSLDKLLLNFKRFYRKPSLEIATADLSKLLNRVLFENKISVEEKNIFIKNLIEDSIHYDCDQNLIEELFSNLLINAIYFAPKNSEITITLKKTNKLIFEIMDQGLGIDKASLSKIFQPFYTTKSSGSGLGLAIVKNIVDAHNGKIVISNNKPNGTIVRIEL